MCSPVIDYIYTMVLYWVVINEILLIIILSRWIMIINTITFILFLDWAMFNDRICTNTNILSRLKTWAWYWYPYTPSWPPVMHLAIQVAYFHQIMWPLLFPAMHACMGMASFPGPLRKESLHRDEASMGNAKMVACICAWSLRSKLRYCFYDIM